MIEKKITVGRPKGIDIRAAAIFVKAASQFESNVWLKKDDVKVNGKSIMGIISLALARGDEVTLEVSGPDEEASMGKLLSILSSNGSE